MKYQRVEGFNSAYVVSKGQKQSNDLIQKTSQDIIILNIHWKQIMINFINIKEELITIKN